MIKELTLISEKLSNPSLHGSAWAGRVHALQIRASRPRVVRILRRRGPFTIGLILHLTKICQPNFLFIINQFFTIACTLLQEDIR